MEIGLETLLIQKEKFGIYSSKSQDLRLSGNDALLTFGA
jgi:hypothetical protein